jgi:hypothetical protein
LLAAEKSETIKPWIVAETVPFETKQGGVLPENPVQLPENTVDSIKFIWSHSNRAPQLLLPLASSKVLLIAISFIVDRSIQQIGDYN